MPKLPFLLDEFESSRWAYEYCKNINDDPLIRKFITKSRWAYGYCKEIKDDPEVRKNITDSFWIYWYNVDVKEPQKKGQNVIKDNDYFYTKMKYKNGVTLIRKEPIINNE